MKNNKNNKGEIMNKFTKVGISALAGSLASFSAQAVEMSVAGSAKLTYFNNHQTEVTGNPYGMNTSLAFTGSGEVNGYATALTIVNNDANTGLSSASLSVDFADMGKVTFDQGVGAGGISTIDDKTPTAAEEVWDGLDATTGIGNGLVGGGNSGVFVYANSYAGFDLSAQVSKGSRVANTDDATSGVGGSGTSWDFALTTDGAQLGVDGMTAGLGYGEIANGAQSGAGNTDTDEHMVVFANYAFGMATVGVSAAQVDHGAAAKESETAMAFGIAVNVNDNLSVSYGEREIDHSKAGATHVDEEIRGFAVAYTMGAAKITAQQNETKDNGGTAGSDDESTQIALSLSF